MAPRAWLWLTLFVGCSPSSGADGTGAAKGSSTTTGASAVTDSSVDTGSSAVIGSSTATGSSADPTDSSGTAGCSMGAPSLNPGEPPDGDPDEDAIPNACDACPLSPETGAVIGENCCDPRADTCVKWFKLANLIQACNPDRTGLRFTCDMVVTGCGSTYRDTCLSNNCTSQATCLPPGALLTRDDCPSDFRCGCDEYGCTSRWCTVGDDLPCEAGMGCLPWFGPGEAPPGLQDLGVCARLDAGPCAGKFGRECATLPPV